MLSAGPHLSGTVLRGDASSRFDNCREEYNYLRCLLVVQVSREEGRVKRSKRMATFYSSLFPLPSSLRFWSPRIDRIPSAGPIASGMKARSHPHWATQTGMSRMVTRVRRKPRQVWMVRAVPTYSAGASSVMIGR